MSVISTNYAVEPSFVPMPIFPKLSGILNVAAEWFLQLINQWHWGAFYQPASQPVLQSQNNCFKAGYSSKVTSFQSRYKNNCSTTICFNVASLLLNFHKRFVVSLGIWEALNQKLVLQTVLASKYFHCKSRTLELLYIFPETAQDNLVGSCLLLWLIDCRFSQCPLDNPPCTSPTIQVSWTQHDEIMISHSQSNEAASWSCDKINWKWESFNLTSPWHGFAMNWTPIAHRFWLHNNLTKTI